MVETEMIQNEIEVTAVGFEVDVEQVPYQWDTSGRRIEANIDQHLNKLALGTPSRRASLTMYRLIAAPAKSPTPGTNPMIESAPSEKRVPGNPVMRRRRAKRPTLRKPVY